MKYVPGNLFVSTLVASIGDIPLSIGGGFLYHYKGPNVAIPIFLFVALCGSISILTWAEAVAALIPIVVLMTRSGVKCAFDSCYLANSTIFPAIFAGTTFGFCNIGAKMFTMFAPLVAEIQKPVPMIVFAVFTGLGCFFASLIRVDPEMVKKKEMEKRKAERKKQQ